MQSRNPIRAPRNLSLSKQEWIASSLRPRHDEKRDSLPPCGGGSRGRVREGGSNGSACRYPPTLPRKGGEGRPLACRQGCLSRSTTSDSIVKQPRHESLKSSLRAKRSNPCHNKERKNGLLRCARNDAKTHLRIPAARCARSFAVNFRPGNEGAGNAGRSARPQPHV
jgi:hypothetical protein